MKFHMHLRARAESGFLKASASLLIPAPLQWLQGLRGEVHASLLHLQDVRRGYAANTSGPVGIRDGAPWVRNGLEQGQPGGGARSTCPPRHPPRTLSRFGKQEAGRSYLERSLAVPSPVSNVRQSSLGRVLPSSLSLQERVPLVWVPLARGRRGNAARREGLPSRTVPYQCSAAHSS